MTIVVGVAGTAKNTGKTTTTSALLDEALDRNLNIGLTSIGYDGEEVDNITGLPKPRLTLKKGSIVATARKCLLSSTAKFEVIESTDIMTPLGRLYIVEIVQGGLVVIAGPNKSVELRRILGMMKKLARCDLIVVDGALNRIAPMVETDGIILATGASKNTDIVDLVAETRALNEIFSLDQTDEDIKSIFSCRRKISLSNNALVVKELKYGFLVDKSSVSEISKFPFPFDTIFIPALITLDMLKELNCAMEENWRNKTLLLKDSTRLAVGGNPQEMIKLINRITSLGGTVKTLSRVPMLAVTVNPFFPRFRFNSNIYEAAHVDKVELKNKMKAAVPTPVIDIKTDGSSELLDTLLKIKKG